MARLPGRLLIVALALVASHPRLAAQDTATVHLPENVEPIAPGNVNRLSLLATLPGDAAAVRWLLEGDVLAVGSPTQIDLYNADGLRQSRDLSATLVTLATLPDDSATVVIGTYDGLTRFWNITSDVDDPVIAHNDEFLGAVSPSYVATEGMGEVTLRDRHTGDDQATLSVLTDFDNTVFQVAISPDESLVTVANRNGASTWLVEEAIRSGFQDERDAVTNGVYGATERSVAFSPDGALLVAGGEPRGRDGSTLRLWRIDDPHQLNALTSPRFEIPVHGIVFHPTANLVAVSARDGRIYLFEVTPTGLLRQTPVSVETGSASLYYATVTDIAFSPDGTFLAAVNLEGDVLIWGVLADGSPRIANPAVARP